jgi:hypothetical protein
MADTIKQRIALDGDSEMKKALADIGDVGATSAKKIEDAMKKASEVSKAAASSVQAASAAAASQTAGAGAASPTSFNAIEAAAKRAGVSVAEFQARTERFRASLATTPGLTQRVAAGAGGALGVGLEGLLAGLVPGLLRRSGGLPAAIAAGGAAAEGGGLGGAAGLAALLPLLLKRAGLPGAIASAGGAAIGLAKVGEDTDRTKRRISALGGSAGAFEGVQDEARALGTSASGQIPAFEQLLGYRRKQLAENTPYHLQVLGDAQPRVEIPTEKSFLAAQGALSAAIRSDVKEPKQAAQIQQEFFHDLLSKNKLTPEAVTRLETASPTAANELSKSLSGARFLEGGHAGDFKNPGQLLKSFDLGNSFDVRSTLGGLEKNAPEIKSAADSARGVSQAFEALSAGTKNLISKFGGDPLGVGNKIEGSRRTVDKAADFADSLFHGTTPAASAPPSVPITPPGYARENGFLVGTGKPIPQPAVPVEAAIQQPPQQPAVVPAPAAPATPVTAPAAPQSPPFFQQLLSDPAALQQRFLPTPAPSPPPAQGQAGPGLASTLLDSIINGAASLIGKKDTAIASPVTLGVRGEGPVVGDDATRKVADLGTAAEEAAAKLRGVATPGSAPSVAHAATGGHIRGPGTSKSDSIPAMLSDGEYVVKADAVKRVGVDKLDAVNNGMAHFAGGGPVSSDSTTRSWDDAAGHHHQITETRNSDGRVTSADVETWRDESGDHTLTHNSDSGEEEPEKPDKLNYNPLTGISLDAERAQDERMKAAEKIAEAQDAKNLAEWEAQQNKKSGSDFVGTFGGSNFADGGPVGHFAKGGPVGTAANIIHDHLSRSFPAFFRDGGIAARLSEAASDYGAHITESMGSVSTPALSSKVGTAPSAASHLGTVDLRTDHGPVRVHASSDTVEDLRSAAAMKNMVSTGKSPSWVGGS